MIVYEFAVMKTYYKHVDRLWVLVAARQLQRAAGYATQILMKYVNPD